MYYCAYCILIGDDCSNVEVDFNTCSDVIEAFVVLTAKLVELLEKADFDKICLACMGNECLVTEICDRKAIISTESVKDLFKFLAVNTPYWSWADIRILDMMVTASGIQPAVKLINDYKKSVYGKKLKDVLPDMLNVKLKEEYYTKIVSKLEKNPDEITVADLLKFRSDLEKVILDIRKGVLVLENVEKGCIEVHWYIPNHYGDTAYNNASKHCDKFHSFNLLNLKIGSYAVLLATSK